MFLDVIAVGLGGAVGAVSRYFLSGWMMQKYPQFEPAGTLLVNVLGCFLIGLLVALEMQNVMTGRKWRAFAITGCLGSLTTFSTFGYQTVVLARDRSFGWATVNVASNLILGIVAILIGMLIGRLFAR
ncbi:fluoride efflux transporter CrcB [Rubinisphaera italica]|uniref:Fluoride-specific ion channel FluC n=1 Tax=Rubinisphaera italica TaxID=2527969 RepID=A0A5C5XHX1_9PLAN|nr:fluoride efflux transporter CrcB [Rubinisphaera italica]TWT62298.1 putative fluoride ion transporter CrcB [Rubinisphaera italica]